MFLMFRSILSAAPATQYFLSNLPLRVILSKVMFLATIRFVICVENLFHTLAQSSIIKR